MKNTFTQSMAWLHTWAGLIFGWLLFAIFVTGTLAVFDKELNHWMQPEIPATQVSQATLPGALSTTCRPMNHRLATGVSACRASARQGCAFLPASAATAVACSWTRAPARPSRCATVSVATSSSASTSPSTCHATGVFSWSVRWRW